MEFHPSISDRDVPSGRQAQSCMDGLYSFKDELVGTTGLAFSLSSSGTQEQPSLEKKVHMHMPIPSSQTVSQALARRWMDPSMMGR